MNPYIGFLGQRFCNRLRKLCQAKLNGGTVVDQIGCDACNLSSRFIGGQIKGTEQFFFLFDNDTDIVQMNKTVSRNSGHHRIDLGDDHRSGAGGCQGDIH